MKRFVMTAALVLTVVLLALTGCSGPAGDVFISFDWVYAPDYFITTDSNLPGTIYRTTDYPTYAGDYYFEYHHSVSGGTHWIYYTLTAHDGTLLVFPGHDARFQIYCLAYDNPTFTQVENAVGPQETPPAASITAREAAPTAGRRVKQYEYTETVGGYDLHLEGGVILPLP